ncbi:hypothetical protein BGZ63DRAFT_370744 [Mariannaea sp. PMI_226]|nr:hypothetical protein BGZ63DRAFT_370744 [Mariannaea sp. PMI_226]
MLVLALVLLLALVPMLLMPLGYGGNGDGVVLMMTLLVAHLHQAGQLSYVDCFLFRLCCNSESSIDHPESETGRRYWEDGGELSLAQPKTKTPVSLVIRGGNGQDPGRIRSEIFFCSDLFPLLCRVAHAVLRHRDEGSRSMYCVSLSANSHPGEVTATFPILTSPSRCSYLAIAHFAIDSRMKHWKYIPTQRISRELINELQSKTWKIAPDSAVTTCQSMVEF